MGMVMKDVGDMPWDERSFAGGQSQHPPDDTHK